MAEKSLEARVAAIEAQLAGKMLQEHFREQAELIDRLFVYRFAEFEKKFNGKLDDKLDSLESRLDVKLGSIQDAVRIVLTRLP